MTDSAKAMMGLTGVEGHALSPEKIQAIKQGMAQAYLEVLTDNAEETGFVDHDVNAQEAWRFHDRVFVDNGLTIEN